MYAIYMEINITNYIINIGFLVISGHLIVYFD